MKTYEITIKIVEIEDGQVLRYIEITPDVVKESEKRQFSAVNAFSQFIDFQNETTI